MDRNFGAEIDSLKTDIEEIKKLMREIVAKDVDGMMESMDTENISDTVKQTIHTVTKGQMHPDPSVNDIMEKLEKSCNRDKDDGAITYLGTFTSGGRTAKWIKNEIHVAPLLELIENKTAEKVLICIGNGDRLNLLLSLLKKPMTVAQLVEECGYHSTGQVYHHLKPLLAADLVAEDREKKGCYVVQPHRVQGIIMLLAGISDMYDPRHAKGTWEIEADNAVE